MTWTRTAKSRAHAACAALSLCLMTPMSTRAELPPLIPRDVLFGNPEKASPRLSPDGSKLAWIAPNDKNVLQVWVQTIGKDDAKPVTQDPKRGIRRFQWGENSEVVLF